MAADRKELITKLLQAIVDGNAQEWNRLRKENGDFVFDLGYGNVSNVLMDGKGLLENRDLSKFNFKGFTIPSANVTGTIMPAEYNSIFIAPYSTNPNDRNGLYMPRTAEISVEVDLLGGIAALQNRYVEIQKDLGAIASKEDLEACIKKYSLDNMGFKDTDGTVTTLGDMLRNNKVPPERLDEAFAALSRATGYVVTQLVLDGADSPLMDAFSQRDDVASPFKGNVDVNNPLGSSIALIQEIKKMTPAEFAKYVDATIEKGLETKLLQLTLKQVQLLQDLAGGKSLQKFIAPFIDGEGNIRLAPEGRNNSSPPSGGIEGIEKSAKRVL